MERINLAIAQGTSILEQVGASGEDRRRRNPLDLPVERLYAGVVADRHVLAPSWSTASTRCRTDDGAPVVDAFFIGVAPGPAEHPDDAVLVNLLSEGEVIGAGFGSAAGVPRNTDTPRFRGYEIPGTFHSWSKQAVQPDDGHAAQRPPVVRARMPLRRDGPVGARRHADAGGAAHRTRPHHRGRHRATSTATPAACARRGPTSPPRATSPRAAATRSPGSWRRSRPKSSVRATAPGRATSRSSPTRVRRPATSSLAVARGRGARAPSRWQSTDRTRRVSGRWAPSRALRGGRTT